MKKVLIAGMVGNGLEWYDYALYGHMAVIIGKLYFPAQDQAVQMMATFGVFALGFIFRPLGAVLFGLIGDRYGRRMSLVAAILLMAIPTGCIGLLPTYAQIGILAPVLLTVIRMLQGLSLGGAFAGSIAYIVEHAPVKRRGIAGAACMISLVVGFLLGSLASLTAASLLPKAAFESWGWRVPFLLGILIGLVGLYIRNSCDESPAYEAAKKGGHLSSRPVRDAFLHHPWEMLQGFCIYMNATVPFYLISIYFIAFTEKSLGRTPQEALLCNFMSMLAMLVAVPISATLSDRMGRRKVLMPMTGAMLVAIPPLFGLMTNGTFAGLMAAQIIMGLLNGAYFGPLPTLLAELFPTSVRYTGMALAYNFSAAIFGGTAPMVSVWLTRKTGTPFSIAGYMALCAAMSLVALAFYKDRFRQKLV